MLERLHLDYRSLGLYRICLGLVLLLDFAGRSLNYRAHYSSSGVLPLRNYLNQPDLSFRGWSIFYINDSPWFALAALLLGVLASGALILGWRTRLAGWTCWILLISLQHRNPLVLQRGDYYLLLLMFWANFLPLAKAFAIDAPRDDESRSRVSFASLAYTMQICCLYWFSAVLRTSPSWQVDGTALYLALNLDTLVRGVSHQVLSLGTSWLAFFSFATISLEMFGPFLLLLPVARARMLGILLLESFHFGTLITMNLGGFAYVCMVAPIGLVPALFWDWRCGRRVAAVFEAVRKRLVRAGGADETTRTARFDQQFTWFKESVVVLAVLVTGLYLAGEVGWKRDANLVKIAEVTGLNQHWGMFSPGPPDVGGWQIAEGSDRAGKRYDLLAGSEVATGARAAAPKQGSADSRWAVYRSNLQMFHFGSHADAYLAYLVDNWNREHPAKALVAAKYIWHLRQTQPDYVLPTDRDVTVASYRR